MGNIPNLSQALMKDQSFVEDLARYAEGIFPEATVRKRWRLEEEDWVTLGNDDSLVRAIEEERVRRIRNGAYKRERAQQLVTKAPDVLGKILEDERASPRHRIDASKVLDDLAEGGPRAVHDDAERVIITINLGGDEKLVFNQSVKPLSGDEAKKLIEHEPRSRGVPGFEVD